MKTSYRDASNNITIRDHNTHTRMNIEKERESNIKLTRSSDDMMLAKICIAPATLLLMLQHTYKPKN